MPCFLKALQIVYCQEMQVSFRKVNDGSYSRSNGIERNITQEMALQQIKMREIPFELIQMTESHFSWHANAE